MHLHVHADNSISQSSILNKIHHNTHMAMIIELKDKSTSCDMRLVIIACDLKTVHYQVYIVVRQDINSYISSTCI